jgi:hypothetical protein
MNQDLHDLLTTVPPGPISRPGDLDRLLAACWHEFHGDDGGMTGDKLLGRREEVVWQPLILAFKIERHDGTVQGSSRASLQQWRLDLDKKTAWCEERRFRQVRARQPRLDVRALAEEVASLILRHQEGGRLRWCEDGRVRVLVGKVVPDDSAVAQTLAGRRKRFRQALRERRAAEGWQEVRVHFFPFVNSSLEVSAGWGEGAIATGFDFEALPGGGRRRDDAEADQRRDDGVVIQRGGIKEEQRIGR